MQCNSTHAQIEMSALGTVECRIDDITGNVITVYLTEHCIIIRCVSNIMSFFLLSVNSIIIVKEVMCIEVMCIQIKQYCIIITTSDIERAV